MRMDEIDVAAAQSTEIRQLENLGYASHEARTFQLPRSIWAMMFGAYAMFFGGLTLAVGGTFDAVGMVIISVCYTIMFFGTAYVLNRVAQLHGGQVADSGNPIGAWSIDTLTGPMTYREAAAQILTVPILFGLFGLAIAVIRSVIIPG